jgi:hypothetical protein
MISRCARALHQGSLFSPSGVSLASGTGINASASHPGDPPLIAHVILRQPYDHNDRPSQAMPVTARTAGQRAAIIKQSSRADQTMCHRLAAHDRSG